MKQVTAEDVLEWADETSAPSSRNIADKINALLAERDVEILRLRDELVGNDQLKATLVTYQRYWPATSGTGPQIASLVIFQMNAEIARLRKALDEMLLYAQTLRIQQVQATEGEGWEMVRMLADKTWKKLNDAHENATKGGPQ